MDHLDCGALVCGALSALIPAGAARAESTAGPLTLSWSAPAECPRERAVLEEARAMLGEPKGDEHPIVANAVVTHTSSGFKVVLTTARQGISGERVLEANACEAVAHASALILLLTVDPSRAVGPAPPSAAPAPPPAPPTSHPPSPPALALLVGATIDRGTLPSLSPGVAAGVAWLSRPLRIEINGAWWASSTATLAGSTAGGTFQLITAGVRACVALPAAAFEIGPCASFDLASIHAEGFGASTFISSLSGNSMWGNVGVGGDAFWAAFGRFGLRLRADGLIPTARPRFVVLLPDQSAPVHRASALGVRALVGAEMRFF